MSKSAELKIRRAVHLFRDLHKEIKNYATICEVYYLPLIEDTSKCRVSFSPDYTESIPLIVGDIIHNLRSSLDILICDIGRMLILDDADKLSFPFAESKEELIEIIGKKTKLGALSSLIGEKIIDIAPFEGGNKILYDLHKLDIMDKHRLLIPIVSVAAVTSVLHAAQNLSKEQGIYFEFENVGADSSLFGYSYMGEILDADIVSTLGGYGPHRLVGPVRMRFGDDFPFSGRLIWDVIDELIKLVSAIVKDVWYSARSQFSSTPMLSNYVIS